MSCAVVIYVCCYCVGRDELVAPLLHRAVLQLYPETAEQIELIMTTAMKCGFKGGLVVDYPNRCV